MAFLMENRLLDRLARTANLLSHTQIVLAGTSGYLRLEEKGPLKKTGIFGFEAVVPFSDPGVQWVATLLIFACHAVLRSMSDKSSAIFWKNKDNEISQAANEFLVALCYGLIDQAGETGFDPEQDMVEPRKEKLLADLYALLNR